MNLLVFLGLALLLPSVFARLGNVKNHRKLVQAPPASRIESQYIISFAPGVDPEDKIRSLAGGPVVSLILYKFHSAFNGIVIERMPPYLLRRLLDDDDVELVEEDQVVESSTTRQQSNPTWGLDSIDQTRLFPDRTYNYDRDGTGVNVYVFDTGIRTTHEEFEGRASCGFNTIVGESCEDLNGHGSHVSGTVAGNKFGVAKGANVIAIKVLDKSGRGTVSKVVAGLDWMKGHLEESPAPAVANLSLGLTRVSTTMDRALTSAVEAGITVVVAAGNYGQDACSFSPGSNDITISVGAVTRGNIRARYSNTGECLDIFAPGSDIRSAGIESDQASVTMSGTSMAAPHVAGVAAQYLQANPGMTPAEVKTAILENASHGVWLRGSGSPNRLLHVSTSEQ